MKKISFIFILIILLLVGCSKRQVSVKFDSQGGTKIDTVYLEPGSLVSIPKNPEKKGYLFLYWEYQNKEFDFEKQKVNNDIVLVARYRKAPFRKI